MVSITRTDLHDELQKFAEGMLQNALTDLHARIVSDLSSARSNAINKGEIVIDNLYTVPGSGRWPKLEPRAYSSDSGSSGRRPKLEQRHDSGDSATDTYPRNPSLSRGFRPARMEPLSRTVTKTKVDKVAKDRVPAGSKQRVQSTEPFSPLAAGMLSEISKDAIDVIEEEEESSLLEPEQIDAEYTNMQDMGNCPVWNRAVFEFIHGSFFNYASCTVVILNSLLIGAQTDYLITHLDNAPSVFETIDGIFCAIFAAELCLRFMAFGYSFFIMEGWAWNVFDLTVVVLQLSDLLLHATFGAFRLSSDATSQETNVLMLLRLLRLIRIIRLMRVLRLVEDLRTIASSIMGSLKSLFWTLALLTVLMYSCGVCITQLVADHFIHDDVADSKTNDLKYYYGSLGRTVLSLFESISGGQSWDCMLDPVMEDVSALVTPIFCSYIAFCLFAVMNSVTGVFCEKATAKVSHDQEIFLLNICRKTFAKNTIASRPEHEQYITWKEFESEMQSEEFKEFFKALNVCASEAEGLFALLDTEKKGAIDFEQFMHGILKLHGPAKALDLTLLMNETDQMYGRLSEHMMSVDARLNRILSSTCGS